MEIIKFQDLRSKIVDNCKKVIVGKDDIIEKVLIGFLCDGHVLLEDVPGTGKTLLLRAFAASVGGDFTRIQFTPDLLPSDLTGINFFNTKKGDFEFRKGPLFSSVILADEINRATPRTQSSLLEAMEERQITVDGVTYPMTETFFVMATQNPLESYGTFPLPDAQIDRFFMRLSLGYMNREEELSVIARRPGRVIAAELTQVVSAEEIREVKEMIAEVKVAQPVAEYLMDLVAATRRDSHFSRGVSTRGAINLYRAAQVKAAICGRDYVIPEDIRDLAVCVLAHRLGIGSSAAESEQVLSRILDSVNVPLEEV